MFKSHQLIRMPAQQINKIQDTTLHENVFCIVLILILHQKYNVIVIKYNYTKHFVSQLSFLRKMPDATTLSI